VTEKSDAVTLDVSRKILAEINRSGDSNHGLSVAQMLLSEGPDFTPELLIVLVESVIKLSAQAGSADATEYLDDSWPTLKPAHLRRLKRKAAREPDA